MDISQRAFENNSNLETTTIFTIQIFSHSQRLEETVSFLERNKFHSRKKKQKKKKKKKKKNHRGKFLGRFLSVPCTSRGIIVASFTTMKWTNIWRVEWESDEWFDHLELQNFSFTGSISCFACGCWFYYLEIDREWEREREREWQENIFFSGEKCFKFAALSFRLSRFEFSSSLPNFASANNINPLPPTKFFKILGNLFTKHLHFE